MENDAFAIGMGALWANVHTIRILANRGLISPNEVETVHSAIIEAIETAGSEQLEGAITSQLGPLMGEIRALAKERWVGRGETNPS